MQHYLAFEFILWEDEDMCGLSRRLGPENRRNKIAGPFNRCPSVSEEDARKAFFCPDEVEAGELPQIMLKLIEEYGRSKSDIKTSAEDAGKAAGGASTIGGPTL